MSKYFCINYPVHLGSINYISLKTIYMLMNKNYVITMASQNTCIAITGAKIQPWSQVKRIRSRHKVPNYCNIAFKVIMRCFHVQIGIPAPGWPLVCLTQKIRCLHMVTTGQAMYDFTNRTFREEAII